MPLGDAEHVDGDPERDHSTRRLVQTRRRAPRFLLVLVVLVAAVASVLVVTRHDGNRDTPDGNSTPEEPEKDLVAQDAFVRAGERLESGGSFAYRGTVQNGVVVDGEVTLPRRLHEVGVDAGGDAYEVVLVGDTAWRRTASTQGGLDATEFETISEEQLNLQTLRLPALLTRARSPRKQGVDWLGRARYEAALGDGSPAAEMRMALDGAGEPVEVAADAADPDSTTFDLRIARPATSAPNLVAGSSGSRHVSAGPDVRSR